MALSTVSGILTADRAGQARPPGAARAAQPLRARAAGRAAAHRRQEARPDRQAGHRVTGHRPASDHAHRRGATLLGWEFVHVCVDDATRLAYVEVLADEKPAPRRVPEPRGRLLRRHGIPVERLMTDNGSAYRSTLHALACRRSGSGTSAPGPTGPAPTAKPSASSAPCSAAGPTARSTATATERTAALAGWLDHYNRRRISSPRSSPRTISRA